MGKSTFYKTRLESLGLPFVNADVIAKKLYPDTPEAHSYKAAQIAENIRNKMLRDGCSFCFETVFSHPSKIDFVAQAKTLGFKIILVFIHLECVSLNKARIYQRVSEGGHSVPEEKVETRIARAMVNIKIAIPLCNHVKLLDNSFIDDPFQQVATIRDGNVEYHRSPLPDWAQELV